MVDDVVELTELLRSSADPTWMRIRELLEERGLSASTSMLAISFPDDVSFEFGIVVTADRHVYQFGLDYLHKPVTQGVFSEWVDLTQHYSSSPFSERVRTALKLLGDED